MQFPLEEGAVAPWLWFSAFALSLICVAAGGFEVLFGREPRSKWVRLGIRLGLFFLAMLAIADLLDWRMNLPREWDLPRRIAVLGVGMLAAVSIARLARAPNRRAAWMFVIMATVSVPWTTSRVVELAFPSTDLDVPNVALSPSERMESTPAAYAETDEGRPVPLYKCRASQGVSNANNQARTIISPELQSHVITLAPPSETTNCHGWVFTGGKAVIQGRIVDSILADNRYQRVVQPREGDLILYRDEQGTPSHTGIVKATGSEGFVLIESKWGFDGLYLHQPQDQCYAKTFEYYRSPRSGHVLHTEGSGQIAGRPASKSSVAHPAGMTGA